MLSAVLFALLFSCANDSIYDTKYLLNKTPSRLSRKATRSLYTAHTSRKVHLNRQGQLSEDK